MRVAYANKCEWIFYVVLFNCICCGYLVDEFMKSKLLEFKLMADEL